VAVAAGALDVRDDDPLGGEPEREREIGAQIVDALAVAPDLQSVALPLRERA
jgi:hypothetical protein